MSIPVIAKIVKGFVGSEGLLDAANVDNDSTSQTGVVSGATDIQIALNRLDGTGVGAPIFFFQGPYSAQSSNIDEWFGGRQQVRMRCTSNGGISPVTFSLPGATALGTAFDQLVTAGLPEVIRFIIEYTGQTTTNLVITPRASPSPQIMGISSVIVPSGVAATLEITRTSGTISDYLFTARGGIGDTAGGALGSVILTNPAITVWDASTNGSLPSTGVAKGRAYKVVNAPSDGSGRFGEVMQTDDWVVWEGETFTAWATEPHAWFVIPAHEVRRITALEQDALSFFQVSPESDRNTIIRSSDPYADSVAEIRIKLYSTQAGYSAADLNTTGDIDEFTDPTTQTSFVAIRLPGSFSSLSAVLPTLYLYADDGSGTFRRLVNMGDDFTHEGDFGAESDYLSIGTINYTANETLRLYVGTPVDRYSNPNLDIDESNLTPEVQAKLNRTDGGGQVDEQRLAAVESKVNALFPLTPDVTDLTGFADIFDPEQTSQSVNISTGYSLLADYRGDATRYESAGVTYSDSGTNVVRYTGLTADLHRCFGFKVSGPADQVLMWIVEDSELVPFVDITAAGNFRINNYTPARTENQRVANDFTFLTRTSGDQILRAGDATVSTFTIPNFPANATQTSRFLQIVTDVYLNGSDTLAGHFVRIDLPAENTAAAEQRVDSTVNLGPVYGNRSVTVTLGYTLRVSGSDLLIDVRLISAPSDITIAPENVGVTLDYTAPAAIARVDNYLTFDDGGGTFTFTGEHEFLLCFQPIQNDNAMEAVAVAIDTNGLITQFNDELVIEPENRFEAVETPDQTTFASFEFRTFLPDHFLIHQNLADLIGRRSVQWDYGLAELRSVTEHAFSEAVDFLQGVVLPSPNGTRYVLTVANDGTIKTEVAT